MNWVSMAGKRYRPTKIICVGINYLSHVREMGHAGPAPEPVIFLKPNSALRSGNGEVQVPEDLGLLHHEVELCVLLHEGNRKRCMSPEEARELILGYGVGIDFTLRDRQSKAKKAGHPWDLAKGFDQAARFSEFVPVDQVPRPDNVRLTLTVNGELRQDGTSADMLNGPAELIAYVSRFMTIENGDVLMTGTPAGVGEVGDGNRIVAVAEGVASLEVTVVREV
jgi:2-keto-4-pentenoate hydratase/2-oxohepta-3-ene-1,7-dioic acid hydratase in catechol pathway